MVLDWNIYAQMLASPPVPPETGGILGIQGQAVSAIYFDPGKMSEKDGIYRPDTGRLNEVITQWEASGILFAGIFHTHLAQWPGLSLGDREYILRIVRAMPERIDRLYFPIVFPGERVRAYAARRAGGMWSIQDDEILLVKKDENGRDST